MRKMLLVILAFSIVILLCGCEGKQLGNGDSGPGSESPFSPPPEATPAASAAPSATPEASEAPEPSLPVLDGDAQAMKIFRDFLYDNYDKLIEASFGSIAGVGFADLDLDGAREMILFDAGASASMGVNIFDIVDGAVECVSANMEPIAAAFGGKNLSAVAVSANFMEDFRLMEDAKTGARFFVVQSANGNSESSYSELIRFGGKNGVLTLSSVYRKYEEYNAETGETTAQKFQIGGADASQADYTGFVESFRLSNKDTGRECKGAFVWENNQYTETRENFIALAERAMKIINN